MPANQPKPIPAFSQKQLDRFWSYVDCSGGPDACWPWIGLTGTSGYGKFGCAGRTLTAHRVSLALAIGHTELFACHQCDLKTCCNAKHLFPGTQADNIADMVSKGRQAVGVKQGTYTHPETRARGDRHGSRTHPERVPRGDRTGARKHPELMPRGEKHGGAKLNEADVRTIRSLYAKGGIAQHELATRFHTTQANVWALIHRRIWTHVP